MVLLKQISLEKKNQTSDISLRRLHWRTPYKKLVSSKEKDLPVT
jgi:hypothetical protein